MDKHERELLADIVGSPGWEVFVRRIVRPHANYLKTETLRHVQQSNLAKAQACLAAAEAVVESVLRAYEGSGVSLPEDMRALRQSSDLTAGAES